jgi:trans-L-3-hydroxyproline dehydratase
MDVDWDPPAEWERITTLDAHAGGEPLRIVTGGLPDIEGETVLEKRRYMREHLDEYRSALMWEPRGHADMYGAVLTDPESDEADFGVLFLHNDGYSTMCGHGIVALGRVAVETGFVEPTPPVTTIGMDTPAGLVTAEVETDAEGSPGAVTFENVPSFVVETDCVLTVPGFGEVPYDLAFGGAFYAYCEADDVGLDLGSASMADLVSAGRRIKEQVAETREITHPTEPDLGFLYGTIICGDAEREEADSRNVCIFADGEVDRSPTGTGVSGRVALRAAAGDLAPGEGFVVESIVGSTFSGRFEERTTVREYDAVVPRVTGEAHVVGRSEFLLDPTDPLRDGFLLR